MANPRLAARYAKSLLDLAKERGELESVFADMQLLSQICKTNRDFSNLLRSPVIKSQIKRRIMEAVTNGRISVLTNSFNALLIAKGRESNLPEIITAFIDQYKKLNNIHPVKLTTVEPITPELREAIITQVKKVGNLPTIELEEKVDPSLIGGFVLQVGDKLVDASISYDLATIARQFENNDFIYRIR